MLRVEFIYVLYLLTTSRLNLEIITTILYCTWENYLFLIPVAALKEATVIVRIYGIN
jgi:hypothetical protein